MGMNGENLHRWIFNTPKEKVDAEVEREMFAKTGAVILGNRTFEVGVDLWVMFPFPRIFCTDSQGARKVNQEKAEPLFLSLMESKVHCNRPGQQQAIKTCA